MRYILLQEEPIGDFEVDNIISYSEIYNANVIYQNSSLRVVEEEHKLYSSTSYYWNGWLTYIIILPKGEFLSRNQNYRYSFIYD